MTEREHVISIIGQEAFDKIEETDLTEEQYTKLFEEIYLDDPDMPYGTKKARTGDPWQWIYDRIYYLRKSCHVIV